METNELTLNIINSVENTFRKPKVGEFYNNEELLRTMIEERDVRSRKKGSGRTNPTLTADR